MSKRYKLAVVTTHPIQYQTPLWRKLAETRDIDIKVYYLSRHGTEVRLDPNFGREFVWDLPLLDGYQHEFVRSFSLSVRASQGRTRWGPTGSRFTTSLASRFRQESFDAVFVHGYASGAAWAGTLAAWRAGIPVIVRGESHDRGRSASALQRLRRQVVAQWMRRVDAVIAIGELNHQLWQGLGVSAERLRVSPYAIDNDRFLKSIDAHPLRWRELRQSWGARPGDPVFLFAGKLTPVKAPDVLLSAFASLPQVTRAHLVFVGSGPLEPALRAFQESNRTQRVHWAGFVNQTDIPHYYRAADVMVLPSRVEPWGLVVNEALACGTPCIVSDMVGSGPDLVEAFGAGLVFPANDSTALLECLRQGTDPTRRASWTKRLGDFRSAINLDRNVEVIRESLALVTRC